jgi:hypothetical protein
MVADSDGLSTIKSFLVIIGEATGSPGLSILKGVIS